MIKHTFYSVKRAVLSKRKMACDLGFKSEDKPGKSYIKERRIVIGDPGALFIANTTMAKFFAVLFVSEFLVHP